MTAAEIILPFVFANRTWRLEYGGLHCSCLNETKDSFGGLTPFVSLDRIGWPEHNASGRFVFGRRDLEEDPQAVDACVDRGMLLVRTLSDDDVVAYWQVTGAGGDDWLIQSIDKERWDQRNE